MAKDLTQGKIMPMLIKFTIPLILGNIFQLTYNAVDSIVVGKFVGKEALAAVGICNPITTLLILFLNGLCMGASILMGNYFGGKKMDTLSRQISTTMVSGMVFSLVLALVTIVFAKPILILVQVDMLDYDPYDTVFKNYYVRAYIYVPLQFFIKHLKSVGG